MPKSKSQRDKKRRAKLQIPYSVEQQGRRIFGPNNARIIKERPEQLSQAAIEELAEAIYEYIADKKFETSAQRKEDSSLIRNLCKIYKKSAIKKQTLFKRRTKMAELRVIYENLPADLSASNAEIEEIEETLRARRPNEQVDYDDIITEIAKLRRTSIDLNVLKKRNYLTEIERIVEDVIKRYEKGKLILLIEGVIIGLVSNGLFELLKRALEHATIAHGAVPTLHVVARDLAWRTEWSSLFKATDEFSEEDAEITFRYVLHVICILSVVGPVDSGNPLFEEALPNGTI